MIDRRHFAVLAAAVVVVLGAAGYFAWRVWDDASQGSLTEPIAVNATLGPQQHMFGDPVRARVDVVFDAKVVDPDSVRLKVSFAPYRPVEPRRTERSASDEITRISYRYTLGCLTYRCLPVGQRSFDLRDATVEYRQHGGKDTQTLPIDWQPLQASGRIPANRLWAARTIGDYRTLPAASWGISPRNVQFGAIVLAVLFGSGALILILRLLPLGRLAERLGLRTVDRRTPLERALERVHETSSAERADEGRRALERLAHELRKVRDFELAAAASRLAWSREFPADGRLTSLTGDVERLISERA